MCGHDILGVSESRRLRDIWIRRQTNVGFGRASYTLCLDIQLLTQRVCALIWTLTQISRRLNCATVVPLAQIAVWQATLTGRVRPPPEPNPLQLICPTLTSETAAGFHLGTRG